MKRPSNPGESVAFDGKEWSEEEEEEEINELDVGLNELIGF